VQGLLDECDDSCDVWFTLALAHHGGCSFERARNCLDEAQEVRAPSFRNTAHALALFHRMS
jgi:hypothetical protein